MNKILVDTSVWIEFFKKKEPYYRIVSELIDNDRIYCIGIVLAELLQGAKSSKELNTLKEFLYIFDFLPESEKLWEMAGELSFKLRGKGISLADCYIAVMANTYDVEVLSLDKHFSTIKKELELKLYSSKIII
jgi:hypothetical protein